MPLGCCSLSSAVLAGGREKGFVCKRIKALSYQKTDFNLLAGNLFQHFPKLGPLSPSRKK